MARATTRIDDLHARPGLSGTVTVGIVIETVPDVAAPSMRTASASSATVKPCLHDTLTYRSRSHRAGIRLDSIPERSSAFHRYWQSSDMRVCTSCALRHESHFPAPTSSGRSRRRAYCATSFRRLRKLYRLIPLPLSTRSTDRLRSCVHGAAVMHVRHERPDRHLVDRTVL